MTDKLNKRYEEHWNLLIERGYIPIEDKENYISMTSKMKYICPKHKDKGIQSIDFYHLKDGRGCYHCGRERTVAAKTITITQDMIEDTRLLCDKNNFDFVELYKSEYKLKVKFICRKHKELGVQVMGLNNMKRNIKGCKFCANKQLPEWYVRESVSKISPHLVIKNSFTLLNDKVNVHCNNHNCDYVTYPKYLLQGHGCEHCRIEKISKNHFLSQQEIQERISIANPSIKIIGEYKGYKNKTEFKCSNCGYTWVGSVDSMILNGTNCPNCGKNKYKGEIKLEEILKKHNINYQRQYCFDNCCDSRTLPFDFAILNTDNQVLALCEYDGEQHYRPVDFSGDKEKAKELFKTTQKHDKIKNTYCKENNIPLIRIPYYQYDDMEIFILNKILENNISINITG